MTEGVAFTSMSMHRSSLDHMKRPCMLTAASLSLEVEDVWMSPRRLPAV